LCELAGIDPEFSGQASHGGFSLVGQLRRNGVGNLELIESSMAVSDLGLSARTLFDEIKRQVESPHPGQGVPHNSD